MLVGTHQLFYLSVFTFLFFQEIEITIKSCAAAIASSGRDGNQFFTPTDVDLMCFLMVVLLYSKEGEQ